MRNLLQKTGTNILPVFLFLFLFFPNLSKAQFNEFGISLGGYNYVGDVNPRYNFLNYRPGGTVFYRYNFLNRYTAIKVGLSAGKLSGNEKNSNEQVAQVRQASFTSTLFEGSLMGEYNFINYRAPKQLLKFSPYLTLGVAVFSHTPKIKTNSIEESAINEGVNIAIPVGLGIKVILNQNWNFGAEFIARKSFTDYIDGISNAQMNTKKTGNPLDDDWYFYTGISLSYTIFGVKCPQEYKN